MPRKKATAKKAKPPPKELVELFHFYARKHKHKNRVPVSELPKMILSLGKSPTASELRNIVQRVEATLSRCSSGQAFATMQTVGLSASECVRSRICRDGTAPASERIPRVPKAARPTVGLSPDRRPIAPSLRVRRPDAQAQPSSELKS